MTDDPKVVKDSTGARVSPEYMHLRDVVTNLRIDMSEDGRQTVTLAAKQAKEDPEAFVEYIIVTLGDVRVQLNSIIDALAAAGIVTIEEGSDDITRA